MRLAVIVLAVAVHGASAAGAQEAPALLKKSGCTACHSNDRKVIGPAYADVAAKYRGDAAAAAKLTAKVKAGGSGVWGQLPMPPNPALSDADLKAMIAYILALAK